jgi:type VI protein secretion system component VasK
MGLAEPFLGHGAAAVQGCGPYPITEVRVTLANVGLGELLWTTFAIFIMVIWLIILFQIIVDIFRSHDMSGWAKAVWIVALFLFTFLTALIYLIVRGGGMAKRQAAASQAAQSDFNDYVKSVAGTGSAADQIAQAKAMLDAGTITQAEFDQLKAKALA